MTDTPRPDAARDMDDRALLENAIADAGAGILPGAPSAMTTEIEGHAAMEEADDPDGGIADDGPTDGDPALTEDRR